MYYLHIFIDRAWETIHRHLEIWMIWIEHICCSTRGASDTISSILKEDTIKALLYYSLVHTYIRTYMHRSWFTLAFPTAPFFFFYLSLAYWRFEIVKWPFDAKPVSNIPCDNFSIYCLLAPTFHYHNLVPRRILHSKWIIFFGVHLLRETQGYAG